MKYLSQGTRTDRALKEANEMFTAAKGHRLKAHKVLIVITDGKTDANSAPYFQVLRPLKVKHRFFQN